LLILLLPLLKSDFIDILENHSPAVGKINAYNDLYRNLYIQRSLPLDSMPNLNVSVLGCLGYSKEFAKKGTASDVTLYNMKKGSTTVTFIEPNKYPEKLASLFYSASFGDYALLVVDRINASLGESILMLNSLGVKEGLVVPRNYISCEQVKKLTRGTVVENYQLVDDDPPRLREHFVEVAEGRQTFEASENGTVIVDHFFNVKGVGTVVLGVVKGGQIHVHDKLMALPMGVTTQVRSIQKHDEDYETAEDGDRVGLALKNIGVENMERGVVLTNDSSYTVSRTIQGKLDQVKYWVRPLEEGMLLHVGVGMQFVSGTLVSMNDDSVIVELDKSIAFKRGDVAAVTYLNAGNLRIIGTVTV
jgi:selenocysteine-specific translation elongation factor